MSTATASVAAAAARFAAGDSSAAGTVSRSPQSSGELTGQRGEPRVPNGIDGKRLGALRENAPRHDDVPGASCGTEPAGEPPRHEQARAGVDRARRRAGRTRGAGTALRDEPRRGARRVPAQARALDRERGYESDR